MRGETESATCSSAPRSRRSRRISPGKPVEDVQRELGLDRVVKLASNEGPFPPFPAALAAMAEARAGSTATRRRRLPAARGARRAARRRARRGLRRRRARTAASTCSARRCSTPATRSSAAGRRSRATSSTRASRAPYRASCRSASCATTSTRCSTRSAARTKIVYVCQPNNPTGTMNTRDELDAFFERVPADVLAVVDQAYFEYIDRPDYPDAVERVHEARPARRRAAHVLEDLRARRAPGRLRGRPARGVRRDGEGAPAVRRDDDRAGRRARERRRRRRDRAPPRAQRRRPRRLGAHARAHGLEPVPARSGTSSTSSSARTRRRCTSGCCAKA